MDVLTHHKALSASLSVSSNTSLSSPLGVSLTLFLSILAVSSAGCDTPDAPPSAFEPQRINTGGDTSGGESASSGAQLTLGELSYQESLEGMWVHYSQVSTCVDIGSSLEQFNRSLYLVELNELPHGGIIETWEACEIDLTPVITVQARVPERLRASVYPLETRSGQVSGAPPEQFYVSGPLIELWGVSMDDPRVDPMPVDADDERISDTDGDGQVGVTLSLGDACEAYMIQRRQSSYTGSLTAPHLIEGEILSVTEQLILDASAPLCKTSYQTRSHPERSIFTRVRVDGRAGSFNLDADQDGTVSCDEVLAARNVLFDQIFELREVDDSSCQL